jgi:hypothetical protein
MPRTSSGPLVMRRFVLAAALAEMLIWIGAGVWAARQTPPFDASGLHAVGIVCILPALALGLWGRWLGLAVGLVSFAAFLYLSVIVAGQISG